MPHLQQLLGSRRRIREGISSIQTYQLSRPFAPVRLKHATLEALHFSLMKIRGIKFLGQAFPHKRSHFTEVSAGLDLILQKSGRLVKTKTITSQCWAFLWNVCWSSFCWQAVCTCPGCTIPVCCGSNEVSLQNLCWSSVAMKRLDFNKWVRPEGLHFMGSVPV